MPLPVRPLRLACRLLAMAALGPAATTALAQSGGVQLDQISVETTRPAVAGSGAGNAADPNASATSGGGGPSGIAGDTARVSPATTKTNRG